jgi:biopolymer transport protein ExbD
MRLPQLESESEGPNLTPVIDVVFLLLIFFLVATRFDREEKDLEVKLPDVTHAAPVTMPSEITVNVTDKGEYIVMGKTLDDPSLAALLRELAVKNLRQQRVRIRADERVPFRYPARVVSMCQAEGLPNYCSVLQER